MKVYIFIYSIAEATFRYKNFGHSKIYMQIFKHIVYVHMKFYFNGFLVIVYIICEYFNDIIYFSFLNILFQFLYINFERHRYTMI